MPYRKLTMVVGFAAALGILIGGARTLNAQPPGFKRVELQKHDLSTPNHEVVVMRGEFDVGAGTPKHTHPGEEAAYILEGEVLLEIDGKPPATLKAGDIFFVPAGHVHSAKNVGKTPAKVLSTYIVEKGKPVATALPPPSPAPAAAK
jgi:quercetin dioxygenase-like cupin family protein